MLALRPYKSQDAEKIVTWIKDEVSFYKWSGSLLGDFPLKADYMNDVYFNKNGLCQEADNFYPWIAFDGDEIIGHFIMRYTDGDKKHLRFGWVIVDDSKRGKGYGIEMLRLGLKYAFEIMKVEQVTIGVYDNNPSAIKCYRSLGFADNPEREAHMVKVLDSEWKCLELVIENKNLEGFLGL